MARPRKPAGELDLELEDLPAPARWREWMGRVEAVIFASAEPVLHENVSIPRQSRGLYEVNRSKR